MVAEEWRRNFAVVWIGQMLSLMGFTFFTPLLPLFIRELGSYDTVQAVQWAGAMTAGTSLAMTLAQPIWGVMADRWGRKPMVVRSMIGSGLTTILMGLSTSAEQLLILYTLQGMVTGTVAACTALVAASTPKRHLGSALGMLQVAIFIGASCGPLGGGLLADALGFRVAFYVAGTMLILGALVVGVLVREDFTPAPARESKGFWSESRSLLAIATFPLLVAVIFLIQFGNTTMSPVISLFIASIATDGNTATAVGAVMAVAGAASAFSAFLAGRMGDRIGHAPILVVCITGSALVYFPQALVDEVWQLILLRMLLGIFLGGLMPSANALVAAATPRERRGAAFGITSSATALSHAVGPIFGAAVASYWGLRAVFLATGCVYALSAVWAGASFRKRSTPSPTPQHLDSLR